MTAETTPQTSKNFPVIATVLELAAVIVLVVAVIFVFQRIALMRYERPIAPAPDGSIALIPYTATLHGALKLHPLDLELKQADFSYHYGRDLHKERMSRTVTNWTEPDAMVEWKLKPNGGIYEVEISYACPEDSAGSTFTVKVGDTPLLGMVQITGGWDQWQTFSLGDVQLGNEPITLTVSAQQLTTAALMDLKSVVLKPKG